MSYLVLFLAALAAANLPFFSNRNLLVLPAPAGKRTAVRLLELVLLYGVVGLLARLLEDQAGPVHSQPWEFYVITFCLFLVLAFPGFVVRYLWRRPGA